MNKNKRHAAIIDLVGHEAIETQEDLALRLSQLGFCVTQSTVSRDIRDLHLMKTSEHGKQRYTYPAHSSDVLNEKYTRVLRDGFISIDTAPGLLVVKTVSGMAMAVAAAIDAMNMKEIIGSIAGDDTIMCAVKSEADAEIVIADINRVIKK
ncbi:MAG: arginine repressor [Lachnospiraceae bacterium]|nr:arginine repressor [Lachnospiraceae bacterium]